MKLRKLIYLLGISSAILISACGGGSSSTNQTTGIVVSGSITLTGDDTAIVGTTLEPVYVDPHEVVATVSPAYVEVSSYSPDSATAADFQNGFSFGVIDDTTDSGPKSITMGITVNGVSYEYACSTPASSQFSSCGDINNITLDIDGGSVSLNGITVYNKTSGNALVLNGVITWTVTNTGGNNNTGNGALTDITGVWKEDQDGYYWTSDRGFADEVYDIYESDGTYISLGYYASENCYDLSYGDYVDQGGGYISLDSDPAYLFVISGNTLTVSYQGDSYTAVKTSLTLSDFSPECI